jgi:hypothetical protein
MIMISNLTKIFKTTIPLQLDQETIDDFLILRPVGVGANAQVMRSTSLLYVLLRESESHLAENTSSPYIRRTSLTFV